MSFSVSVTGWLLEVGLKKFCFLDWLYMEGIDVYVCILIGFFRKIFKIIFILEDWRFFFVIMLGVFGVGRFILGYSGK